MFTYSPSQIARGPDKTVRRQNEISTGRLDSLQAKFREGWERWRWVEVCVWGGGGERNGGGGDLENEIM